MYLAKKTDRLACPTAIKINKVHCNVYLSWTKTTENQSQNSDLPLNSNCLFRTVAMD